MAVWEYMASCEGKEAYSRGMANELALRRRVKGRAPVRAYKCSYCGKWHIGCRGESVSGKSARLTTV